MRSALLLLLLLGADAWADCGVSLAVSARGVVVDHQKIIASKNGAIDRAALDAELAHRKTSSCTQATITASPSLPYAEVVAVMDSARAAGFTELVFATDPAPASQPAALVSPSDAILVAISPTEILVEGKVVVSVADAAKGRGSIPELAAALPPPASRAVVLAADQSTPQAIIRRVLDTASATGHTNVVFAVKSR